MSDMLPLLLLIGIAVVALSVLSLWQYGVALRRQQLLQDVADRQQNRAADLLPRQNALMDRAESLVRRLEERVGNGVADARSEGIGTQTFRE